MVQAILDKEVIQLLSNRGQRSAMGGTGIRTADEYVRSALNAGEFKDREATIKEAEGVLVYRNDDMTIQKSPMTSTGEIERFCKEIGADLPPRTIMVFENVITTPKKDRDGDILRTEGAEVDPKMPLLWQHVPSMPIGKMLKVLDHTKRRLLVASAIVDSSLGHDTAVLIDFGGLRISHGFRIFEWEELKKEDYEDWPGLDIKRFEIMEESAVSVPSNTDAVITAFSRGKLTDPTVKRWAKGYSDNRRMIIPVSIELASDGKTVSVEGGTIITAEEFYAKGAKETDLEPTKGGKVLSKANETRLQKAKELIDETLATAGEDDDERAVTATTAAIDLSRAILTATKEDLDGLVALRNTLDHAIRTIE